MRVGRRWRPGIRQWEPVKSADQRRPTAVWRAGRAAVQRPPWSEDHTVAACRRPPRIWAADPWRRWRQRRRCSGSPAQQPPHQPQPDNSTNVKKQAKPVCRSCYFLL
jgi:hypothetical protein